MKFAKKHIVLIELSLVCFLFNLLFLNKGITLYDEGYILESALLSYLGKIPYKDFFFQYTPLTVFIGSMWFKIFGPGIINLRVLALIISSASTVLGYIIARRFGKPSGILVFITLLAWGFAHANFLWPSSVSLVFLFLTIYLFVLFIENKKNNYIFLAGITAGLLILTKQNLGMAIFAGGTIFTIYYCLKEKRQLSIIYYFLGTAIAILPFAFYLYLSGSVLGFKELLVRSSIFARREVFLFPYRPIPSFNPSQESIIKWAGKTFTYFFPVALFVLSSLISFKRRIKNPIWYLVLLMTLLYFVSMVWPTADLAHMTFAIPAVVLATAVLLIPGAKVNKTLVYLFLIVFSLIGFYKIFFMSYYTFETPYKGQNIPVKVNRDTVYVDTKHKSIIDGLEKFRKDSLEKNDLVFVHPYAPMIYYVLGKVPPVYELYTVSGLLSEENENNVVNGLKSNKVNWVFDEEWRSADHTIDMFIDNKYEEVKTIWDIDIRKLIGEPEG